MKIVQLPDSLYDYLLHLLEKYASKGIHPEEGIALTKLWEATIKATSIDDAQIAKMTAGESPQSAVENLSGVPIKGK